jgi:hypothetical protein
MKGILEYYDKELDCKVQVDIEGDTILKMRKACQKELEGKKYKDPALYVEEEQSSAAK